MVDVRSLVPATCFGFIAAAIVGYVVSSGQPASYEASLLLTDSSATQRLSTEPAVIQASRQRLALYGEIATQAPTLEAIGERFGIRQEELRKRVRTSTTADGAVLEITVRDREPSRAAAVANAIGGALADDLTAQVAATSAVTRQVDSELVTRLDRFESVAETVDRLRSRVERSDRQQRRLQDLEADLGSVARTYTRLMQFSQASSPERLVVLSPASTPRDAIAPVPTMDAFLAGCLGALFAMPLGLIPHFLDSRVRRAHDIGEETGLATLAVIPRVPGDRWRPTLARLAVLAAPDSQAADAYRRVR